MDNKVKYLYADKREQVKKANHFLIVTNCFYYLFSLGIVYIALARGVRSAGYTGLVTIISAVTLIASFILYGKNRESRALRYVSASGMCFLAFILSIGFDSYYLTFMATVPFITSILFFDIKFSFMFTFILSGVNILAVLASYSQGKFGSTDVVLDNVCATFTVALCLTMAALTAKRSHIFIEHMLGSIQDEQKKEKEMMVDILKVADNIKAGTEGAMELVNELNDSTAIVNGAVSDISESTLSTAENIQTQTVMTQNIQESITNTLNSTTETVELANELEKINADSIRNMNELKKHAQDIAETNSNVAKAMKSLQERTNDVKSIADTIFSISNQTNLLALNASIESARAGEAGRGFAVVADEIRQLAEKTRQETENIARILDELNANAKEAGEAVESSVLATEKQDEMIVKASDCFTSVSRNVEKVTGNISDINDMLNNLSSANNQIVDNIMQLSATTQEVTASSSQAAQLSQDNLNKAEMTKNNLYEVLKMSHQLEKYTDK